MSQTLATLEGLGRLNTDLRNASKQISDDEARFLVDYYYIVQEDRKRSKNQVRALSENAEPNDFVLLAGDTMHNLEKSIKYALDKYSASKPIGQWIRAQVGIGPVISAGLIAYIDIHKAPAVGHIWRYAGLDPTCEWLGRDKARKLVTGVMDKSKKVTPAHLLEIAEKTNRRVQKLRDACEGNPTKTKLISYLAKLPYNKTLKTLTVFKLGECFVKTSGKKDGFYGHIYLDRKEQEWQKNMNGDFADQAAKGAERVGKTTAAYKWYSGQVSKEEALKLRKGKTKTVAGSGKPNSHIPMLPPAHIHARARRYAVKLFLSHLQTVWRFMEFGELPPRPWILTREGHCHEILPPKIDMVPGLQEAFEKAGRA